MSISGRLWNRRRRKESDMRKLKLDGETVAEATSSAVIGPADRTSIEAFIKANTDDKKNVDAPLPSWPTALLRAILDDGRVTVSQRTQISLRLFGMKAVQVTADPIKIWDHDAVNPSDVCAKLTELGAENNCEIKLNGRWYIASMNLSLYGKEKNLAIDIKLRLGRSSAIGQSYSVYREQFRDTGGNKEPKKIRDLLGRMGIRQMQTKEGEHNLLLVKSERMSNTVGGQMRLSNSVLRFTKGMFNSTSVEMMSLGTKEWPRNVIVEPSLEEKAEERSRYADGTQVDSRLPFVRVFSLDKKEYVFCDVRDLVEYDYDETAIERLQLPDKTMNVLRKVFATPTELLMSDIIRGKHGGLVILACGPTGVGKTLTAEVYSEFTRRPLYTLQMGELGTTVEKVEHSLSVIFERVARWNAVLLFDEVDVFLQARGDDLNRSAIVGIFLRLMDYYRGVMFLSTNRPEVLDKAIRSRVTLKLDYQPFLKTYGNLRDVENL
jgi:hypothetical protein